MLNPIFWTKVQGQKQPGRWGIVEHQIPSIKVLFKINAESHKHPCIKLLSSESKTQLVNQRKQKVAFNPGTAHSPEIQSYIMWWGAASPILNDTPVACIYTSYNRTHIENAYIKMMNWLWVILPSTSHFLCNVFNYWVSFEYLICTCMWIPTIVCTWYQRRAL